MGRFIIFSAWKRRMENYDSFNPELEWVVTKTTARGWVALSGERGMFTSLKGGFNYSKTEHAGRCEFKLLMG
jgi:hypothetical protein